MNLEAHTATLNARHAEIENAIETEEHRPNPDTMRLMQLKRQKLKLKEEITRISAPSTHH